MVRFGIIGAGRIAGKFAEAFSQGVQGASLTAVASNDAQRAQTFAQTYAIGKSYGSYAKLLEDADVDAVYIATTNNAHFDCCMQAIEAGKHVLCEKPMVMSAAQSRTLADAAAARGVFLMEAMWTRFLPAMQQARQWIEQGRIGQVKLVSASFCSYRDPAIYERLYEPALGGGALYDLGVYVIEGSQFLLGQSTPVKMSANCVRAATGVDITTLLSLEFANGALAQLVCSVDLTGNNDIYVYGSSGHIHLSPQPNAPQEVRLYTGDAQKPAEIFVQPVANGFEYQITHVAQCIQDGLIESPIMPLRDTVACAEIFDRALAM